MPGCRCIVSSSWCCTTRSPAARSAPGDALPTEQSLCDQFGVSRITVRRALADLAEQGYIERRQGVGSFVRQLDRSDEAPLAGSYMDNLRQTQFQTSVDVVEHDSRTPPATIGDTPRLARTEMLHILRVRRERRTREPLMITEAWLPADLSQVLTAAALRRTPLYELLSGAGVVIDRMQHEITAEIAGPRNAGLLERRDRVGTGSSQPAGIRGRRAAPLCVDPAVAQPQSCVDDPDGGRVGGRRRIRDRPRRAPRLELGQHRFIDRVGIRRTVAGAGHQRCQGAGSAGPAQRAVAVDGPAGGQHTGEHIAGARRVDRIHDRCGHGELRIIADVPGTTCAEGGDTMRGGPNPVCVFGFVDDQDVGQLGQLRQLGFVAARR